MDENKHNDSKKNKIGNKNKRINRWKRTRIIRIRVSKQVKKQEKTKD